MTVFDFALTPLLDGLQQHCNAPECVTVQDFLCSSELPCKEVATALMNIHVESQQTLQLSAASISAFMLTCKTHCKGIAPSGSDPQPSRFFITKLATVDRFLQFSLEHWLRQRHSAINDAAKRVHTDSELNKTISQVIQGWAGLVCSLLEANQDAESEDVDSVFTSSTSESFDAHQIAFFSCGCLIRLNHYARFLPSLLSPLWKAICNVVDTLSTLPSALADKGSQALSEYLKEGLHETIFGPGQTLIKQVNQSIPTTIDTAKIQFGQKILLFLLSRLATFLSRCPPPSVNPDAVAALITIMGVNGATQARLSQTTQDATLFFTVQQKLSDKAGKVLLAHIMGNDNEGRVAASGNSFRHDRLACLVKVQPPSWSNASTYDGLVHAAFAVGKARILIELLSSAVHRRMDGALSETDVNSLLRTCQELLLVVLPLCHETAIRAAVYGSDCALIHATVTSVSCCLLFCENYAPSLARDVEPGRSSFHGFLLGLLLPPSNGSMHPLSREVVIDVLRLHLHGLCSKRPSECGNLLGMTIKLLFSPKLCTSFRSNLASLLSLILDGPSSQLKESVMAFMRQETPSMEDSLQCDKASKKRKRNGVVARWRPDDLRLICRVVGKCSFDTALSCTSASLIDVGKKSLSQLCFRAALATAACRSGSALGQEYLALIMHVQTNLNTQACRNANCLTLMEALSGYIQWSFATKKVMGATEPRHLVVFLSYVCEVLIQGKDQYHVGVLFEAIHGFWAFATSIGPFNSEECLDVFGKACNILLSYSMDEVRSETLSMLVQCLQSMSADDRARLLQLSVPSEMRRPLAYRIKGRAARTSDFEDLLSRHVASSNEIRCLSGCIHLGEKVLSTTKRFCIRLGSYVLQMPTSDERCGRSAIAIFSPDKESLDDIKLIQDDSNFDALTIRRVEVLGDGSFNIYVV